MSDKPAKPDIRKTQILNCLIDKGVALIEFTLASDNYPYMLDKIVFRTHPKINATIEIIDNKRNVLYTVKVERENLTEINANILLMAPDKRYKVRISGDTDCATFLLLSGKRVDNAAELNTIR